MAAKVAPIPMEETEALKETSSSMTRDDDCDPYIKITIPSLRQTRET
eukprot:COSAG02_NODE_50657_length_319_cov_0.704545_1_plen_46_part_10